MQIIDILTERNTITNDDREDWIDNDRGLYDWWKETGLSKNTFMTDYKSEIDNVITNALGTDAHLYDPVSDAHL